MRRLKLAAVSPAIIESYGHGQLGLEEEITFIRAGVVQDEALAMHEVAVEPQRGAGIGELRSFDEAGADGRASNALVDCSLLLLTICSPPKRPALFCKM
jgi:hypothetical protein